MNLLGKRCKALRTRLRGGVAVNFWRFLTCRHTDFPQSGEFAEKSQSNCLTYFPG